MYLSVDILLHKRIYLYLGYFNILNDTKFREHPRLLAAHTVVYDRAYMRVAFNGVCDEEARKKERKTKREA